MIGRNGLLPAILLSLLTMTKSFSFPCTSKYAMNVTGSLTGSAQGSNPYNDGSSWPVAAVHSGLLQVGQQAEMIFQQIGFLNGFSGTTANGVTSTGCGPYFCLGCCGCGVDIYLNCSIIIVGCVTTNCKNTTYCTQCQPEYGLDASTINQQNCTLCSVAMANCLLCTVTTTCTMCDTGYYIITAPATPAGQCDLCRNQLPYCLTCTDAHTCQSCDDGYQVNSTTNHCQCDISVASKLPNCLACLSPTVCTSCNPPSYFLNLTDDFCHPCSDFDSACSECSDLNVCTECQNDTYTLISNNDSTTSCVSCSTLISNCTTCSSPTVCTKCDLSFGLDSVQKCQACIAFIEGCINCDNDTSCLTCQPTYVLVNGTCKKCNQQIFKCNLCDLGSSGAVQCSECQNGFYLLSNECQMCLNIFDYCDNCSINTCFGCISPYYLGQDGLCSQCVVGYTLVDGICMNIPGCKSSKVLPNGTQICLACAQQLNFIYDANSKKCVCVQGFTSINHTSGLISCQSVCGDGILVSNFEECDDKNVLNNDGCDSECKVEKDFTCTSDSPSQCTLYLNFSSLTFNYVSRVLGQNKGILSFSIEPKHAALQKLNWSKLIKFSFPASAVNPSNLKFTYSSDTGELLIQVPYNEALEGTFLETSLIFDPQIIVSDPNKFGTVNKLNGINAPLVFEEDLMHATFKCINVITLILVVLLLLQFYLGSYFHKMIGLQTINVIQSIYFVRMISASTSTSLLSSMNVIEYSASGYQNAELFYGPLSEISSYSIKIMAPQFTAINMKPFFLLNINLLLVPVLLALIGYSVSLAFKYHSLRKYYETEEQTEKDRYRDLRRSAQSIYDHFLFPYVMMFNMIIFFFTVAELSKKSSGVDLYDNLRSQSFPVYMVLGFVNLAILCYETFNSMQEFATYRMTPEQRQKLSMSKFEKLEQDQNNPDRANYHPGYVMVYMIYYRLLCLAMILSVLIENFTYSLELTMGLSIGYFLLICIWRPYHESINLHNHFLRLYYGTFVLFLIICYIFSKIERLPNTLYIALIYVIMVLVFIIMVVGFVRILIQKIYRKRLQNDNTILEWTSQETCTSNEQKQKQNRNNIKKGSQNIKKELLYLRNPYLFKNQIKDLGIKYGFLKDKMITSLRSKKEVYQFNLSKQQQNSLLNQIREQVEQERRSYILNQFLDSYLPKQSSKIMSSKISQQFANQGLNSNQIIEPIVQDQNKKMLRYIRQKLKRQLINFE